MWRFKGERRVEIILGEELEIDLLRVIDFLDVVEVVLWFRRGEDILFVLVF